MNRFLAFLPMMTSIALSTALPGVGPLLAPLVVKGIQDAMSLPSNATGADKLNFASQLVKDGLAGANIVHPGLLDQSTTDDLIKNVIGSVYDSTKIIAQMHDTHASLVAALPPASQPPVQ